MLNKLQAEANRYAELCAKSEQPDFYADPKKAAKLLREKNDLEPIVETFQAYRETETAMADALELMADPEMKEMAQEEFSQAKAAKEELFEKLQILLLPKDPNDDKNVIVEIRGGVGGEESALFAHSLFRMYSMYAARQNWSVELLNYTETELGGVKEADFLINGRGAYSRMKWESGVHRVQRVPETESGGRVHTSTATVAVLPENGRGGCPDRSQGYRNAGIPGFRRRRPAREQNLLRCPADPQAQRHRGGLPGGKIPAPKPGKMYADAGLEALRDGAGACTIGK